LFSCGTEALGPDPFPIVAGGDQEVARMFNE
jgi:hypothetical protein